jgi:hypothetical protein
MCGRSFSVPVEFLQEVVMKILGVGSEISPLAFLEGV